MPVPQDPRVRHHRARIAAATRDGNAAVALESRHVLDLLLVERALLDVAPSLTAEEQNRLALIALGEKP